MPTKRQSTLLEKEALAKKKEVVSPAPKRQKKEAKKAAVATKSLGSQKLGKGTVLFDGDEDWVFVKRAARRFDEDEPKLDGAWYAKSLAEVDFNDLENSCEWSGIDEIREWAQAADKNDDKDDEEGEDEGDDEKEKPEEEEVPKEEQKDAGENENDDSQKKDAPPDEEKQTTEK